MIVQRGRQPSEAGISLLEVLMAISLLGISFASIFSGLSAALRTTDHLDQFDRANQFATHKLSELFLDPSISSGQARSGVTPSGITWQERTQLVGTRPLGDPNKPAELVRILLDVSWHTRSGQQKLSVETLKLCIPEPPRNP